MAGNTSWEAEGRINQKRRTRAVVLEAAKRLLREGQTPSVAEAADAARVSRASAYRYFPTQQYLLTEAALESAHPDIYHLLERSAPPDDPVVRLDTLVRLFQQVTLEYEAAFRTMLQLSLEAHVTGGHNREATEERLRGADGSAGSRRHWPPWAAPSRRTRPPSDAWWLPSRCAWALRPSLCSRTSVACRQRRR
jgi:AcrR family transcriptional regulator